MTDQGVGRKKGETEDDGVKRTKDERGNTYGLFGSVIYNGLGIGEAAVYLLMEFLAAGSAVFWQ